ncbi:hypothetical protein H312_01977 [Anncaliia algerae PRA339]|uniref:MRG domain-containing protein n=1 Tax=Anncaliia algerae PRA339 TaxID=1288291 RepID=A0A059F0I3_9MICR|nr:hypothetical protein H312_01977 [Anncaliia algerae PRA339]
MLILIFSLILIAIFKLRKKYTKKMIRKFNTNNFIITKLEDEWFEGRVVESLPEQKSSNEVSLYRVYVFRLFTELSQPVKEYSLMHSTPENIRKFKLTSFRGENRGPHFPSILKETIIQDKQKTKENFFLKLPAKYPISRILNDFKKFIQLNKGGITEEELDEIVLGFCHLFETTFFQFLLYSNELDYVNQFLSEMVNIQKTSVFGAEYLLRLIFLLHKKLLNRIECSDTADLTFDFSIYLLDFMALNYERYFSKDNYLKEQ